MTAFNIDRFTTSGASDLAFGTRGEITTTFPQTALGARATTVLAEPPRTSWSAEGLSTALLEREAFGGQAGTDQELPGLPDGVSGGSWRSAPTSRRLARHVGGRVIRSEEHRNWAGNTDSAAREQSSAETRGFLDATAARCRPEI
jgi:hypothetical protein